MLGTGKDYRKWIRSFEFSLERQFVFYWQRWCVCLIFVLLFELLFKLTCRLADTSASLNTVNRINQAPLLLSRCVLSRSSSPYLVTRAQGRHIHAPEMRFESSCRPPFTYFDARTHASDWDWTAPSKTIGDGNKSSRCSAAAIPHT